MKKFLKTLLIPVSLLLTLSITACGPSGDPTTPSEPGGSSEPGDSNATITGIRITKNPNRMVYQPGEYLDLTGIQIAIDYSDETFDYAGAASVSAPNTPLTAGQTEVTITFRNQYSAVLTGLTVKKYQFVKLEAEASYAYWMYPNNKNLEKQFTWNDAGDSNASGKFIGNLGKECYGVVYHFNASQDDTAKLTLCSDFQTRTNVDNAWNEPSEMNMSDVYELHVNGQKVSLAGLKLYDGEWLNFINRELASIQIKEGFNSIALYHILRNGENGNIDYIGLETGAEISPITPNKTKIEGETMAVSGSDIGAEGNNASGGQAVRNRGSGQAGWAQTVYSVDSAKTVSLVINFGLNQHFNMSEWNIWVNNKKVSNVDATIPYHYWAGIAWVDWNEIYICDLQLEKGSNTIKIEKPDTGTHGTNMDYIVILEA